ncbi:hypothetical protein ASD35_03060 [Pelomonas sp. Root1444]|nr:hypothetical protein ASD35_03060 [Pelomonas sp. Root1444]
MVGIQKATLQAFPCNSQSQCRVMDGSTNEFLSEPRAIEELLKDVEPRYGSAIANLGAGSIGAFEIFAVSGFVAMVFLLSPTGRRLGSAPMDAIGNVTARMLDAHGKFGPPPPGLEGTSLTDLLDSGQVEISTDDRYPQAIGVTAFHDLINSLGNCNWEILANRHADSPFFTSDFPIALETTADLQLTNKVVPLSPNLAVRIWPTLGGHDVPQDFSFPRARWRFRSLSRSEVRHINSLIVQAADTAVYCQQRLAWTDGFIERHRHHRVDAIVQKFPTGNGVLLMSAHRIVSYQHPPVAGSRSG